MLADRLTDLLGHGREQLVSAGALLGDTVDGFHVALYGSDHLGNLVCESVGASCDRGEQSDGHDTADQDGIHQLALNAHALEHRLPPSGDYGIFGGEAAATLG